MGKQKGITKTKRGDRQAGSIRKKIILHTIVLLLVVSFVVVGVMSYFMTDLTNTILLDTLQPMAKSASQSIENNLHLMADRIFMIADDAVFSDETATVEAKQEALDDAKSGIEFVWLALYNSDGSLYTGSEGSPASIAGGNLYQSMEETANLVIDDTEVSGDELQIVIGTPVMQNDQTAYYLVGSYKYDVLNDVLSNINVGATGTAFIINEDGTFMAHQDTENVKGNLTIYEGITKKSG